MTMFSAKASRASRCDRDGRIVALVAAGATFGEAAAKLGVTRDVVSGVCRRAGVSASGGSRSKGQRRYLDCPEHLQKRRDMMAYARSRRDNQGVQKSWQ